MPHVKLAVVCLFFAFVGVLFQSAGPADAKGKKDKDKDKKKVELKVKVGDAAPAFNGVDESGQPVKSTDFVGKKIVVLFFYPSNFTGNSVAQARGDQEEMEILAKLGVAVIGISGESPASHKLFKSYYKLPYTLVADEKGEFAKAFGVPVGSGGKSPTINEKGEKGEADRNVTIDRWTIVIDKAGKVAAADAITKGAGEDAKRVAELVKKLEKK